MTQAVLQPESTDRIRSEYDAIRNAVGLIDFSSAGKLKLSGKNSIQFLNGLVSNDVKTLQPGDGILATFPTLQGKLSALCRIYNTGEHLLIELDAINREKIFKNLSRFVPAGEFFVTDASDALALVSLCGPRSAELVEALAAHPIETADLKISKHRIAETEVWVASHRRCGEMGFDLFVETESAANVRQAILNVGQSFGIHEVGDAAFEIARIEDGVAREGMDAGED